MAVSAQMVTAALDVTTGALGGGAGAAIITRFFFMRYVRQNDDRHKETEVALKGINNSLAVIVKDMAVAKTIQEDYQRVQTKIERDHDNLIKLTTVVDTLRGQLSSLIKQEINQ